MARSRNKIQYCYQDYMKHCSEEEKTAYEKRFAPLVEIINRAVADKEILAQAKEYDRQNNTEMFAEAVHLTIYCIACNKFDCDC